MTGARSYFAQTAYFSAADTVPNVVLSFEPRVCTVAMMATEMPAAINPYSIAVTPLSSFRNLDNKARMLPPFQGCPVRIDDLRDSL